MARLLVRQRRVGAKGAWLRPGAPPRGGPAALCAQARSCPSLPRVARHVKGLEGDAHPDRAAGDATGPAELETRCRGKNGDRGLPTGASSGASGSERDVEGIDRSRRVDACDLGTSEPSEPKMSLFRSP